MVKERLRIVDNVGVVVVVVARVETWPLVARGETSPASRDKDK